MAQIKKKEVKHTYKTVKSENGKEYKKRTDPLTKEEKDKRNEYAKQYKKEHPLTRAQKDKINERAKERRAEKKVGK